MSMNGILRWQQNKPLDSHLSAAVKAAVLVGEKQSRTIRSLTLRSIKWSVRTKGESTG